MTKKKEEKTKYNTIILDTSTELENVLRQYVFEEISATKDNKKKLAPNEYILRNSNMKSLFDMSIDAGVNLVSLQYMKTKWAKDNKGNLFDTGEKIIDGWQRTESQADINIEMKDATATIVSNWADRKFNGKTYANPDYETIITEMLVEYYGEDEDFPALAVSITGDAKSGKTHTAFSWPEPIKVYAFNRGADFVRRKFPDKHIDVVYYKIPIIDEDDTKVWAEHIWKPFYKDFKETLNGQ